MRPTRGQRPRQLARFSLASCKSHIGCKLTISTKPSSHLTTVLQQLPSDHPSRIEILLQLGTRLSAEDADAVIDYYERECLCLPFTEGWTKNLWKLLRAFMLVPNPRLRVGRLLLRDVYAFASDSPEARIELVDHVLIPFLSEHLAKQQDREFQRDALAVLVTESVTETFERDEEMRQLRVSRADIAQEDASPEASAEVTEKTFSGSFNTVRGLIAELAHLPCDDSHTSCRPISAVTSLIAIFTRLCFTPSQSTQSSVAVRMPASFRSIIIFRDLLGLLYPMTDDRPRHIHTPTQVKVAARCPRARLIILDWLMRLRADQHHRIFVKTNMDRDVAPFADMLQRTDRDEERGRSSRPQEASRSRSRSRAIRDTYTPLWYVPQQPIFEIPPGERSSDIMTTYDPFHPALKNPDAPPIDGVWLPVSQYVRVLNGILRGHDWELVSYVLCFLPLQLRNKLFFHGKRAVKEVQALLHVLVDGVMARGGNWEKRYNVPAYIKRVDINAIAYQSLSIMVAYRGTLRRDECDALVQSFTEGLQGRKELAKPCLQALTLCIFEMEQYVARHLLNIIERMERIVTTTALAVHILEFLMALGQNGSLFRNFTDEQYRRVFHVAIDYITIHNARSDEPVELEGGAREEYTLSQHVIGLAYHSIYLWFLSLKLPQRPNLVPEITRKLLQGRSKRVIVDEMAEVCFDWLARYTYGNADPRPATSFLTEVVMAEERESDVPKTLSWLLGGAIVTVTSHARTGWATISTTRPTGSTSIVSKLENVPLLDIGESNADLASLPAFLMANRNQIAKDPNVSPELCHADHSCPNV